MEETLSPSRPVDSEHAEALWGQSQCYYTKVNCSNRDDWTWEQLQVILHYPDQRNHKYTTDPTDGQSMSYRLLIYVSGRADLKCEEKEPSESDKLIIDVIGIIKMSMKSFTKLVCFGVQVR